MAKGPIENYTSLASQVYIRPEFQEIAQDYLDPLRRCDVDTLVLGCTHFPLLKSLIGGVMGREVVLISSASEVARDCADILSRQGIAARPDNEARYESSRRATMSKRSDDLVPCASFSARPPYAHRLIRSVPYG